MPISPYIRELREHVGSQLLQLPSVTVLIRDDTERLLLVRQTDPEIWSTPGGAIEPLETPADAAVREAWEETGLDVRITRLVGAFGGAEYHTRYANGDEVSYVQIVFEAAVRSGALRPDGDEVRELRFFSLNELAALSVPKWLSEVLSGRSYRPAAWRPVATPDD